MAVVLKIDDLEMRPARITGDMFLALIGSAPMDELKHAELIDGVLVDMTPANNRHALAHGELYHALRSGLREAFRAFIDPILRLGTYSLVGPDIAVLRKGVIPEGAAPNQFLLCIEIADATLDKDLKRKAELCGTHGVPEYWVVDLENRKLHVHRDAGPQGYGSVVARGWEAPASPMFAPELVLDIGQILEDIG